MSKMTTKQAADFLGVSKPRVLKLIYKGKLEAELQEHGPVKYYLINSETVKEYKNSPKSKGGRPKKHKNK